MPDTPSGKIPLDDLFTFEKRIKGTKVLNRFTVEYQLPHKYKNHINNPCFKSLQVFKKDG